MTEEQKQTDKKEENDKPLRKRIYRSPEGKIFIMGLILLVSYCLWLSIVYLIDSEDGRLKVAFSISRLFIGNPAGIFLGHTMGFSQKYILFANLYIETVIIFIFYPLLTFILREFLVIPVLEPVKRKFLKSAESRQKTIKKYGVLGLFIFTLFPVWGKGPIVASLIGFLMKLNPWVNMSVVLSGTYLATIMLFYIFKHAHSFVLSFNPRAPVLVIALFVFVIVGINAFQWLKRRGV